MLYLPHSQVHNDWTVPIVMSGCIAHARNGHISTSALNSEAHDHHVPRPEFLSGFDNFCDFCTFKADIGLLNICMDLRTSWRKMRV